MSLHSFRGFGRMHGFGRRGGFHSQRRQGRHRWHQIFAPVEPDPQVQWAQGCLAQAVDPSVPQDGILGPQTRQAIQTFQSQQQLHPTGVLEPNTVSALQLACSGQPGADPTAAMAPPGGSGSPAGSPSGRQGRHEIAQQEGEFPGEHRFHRDERFREGRDRQGWDRDRRWDRDRERRWPFLEVETGGAGEGEFRFHRDERYREERDRRGWDRDRRWERDRERRWPLLEIETGGAGEGEFRFHGDERFREGRDRRGWDRDRRWDRDRERRWPFMEAETGGAGEGEFRFHRDERFREERDRRGWDRDRRWERDRERRWPFLEVETGGAEREVRQERLLPRAFEPHPQDRFGRDRVNWGPERRWFFNLPENRRIAWAQSCLAQVLGPWVVQDGVMGPNTAAALRTFQEREQLPVVGVLDEATIGALHGACGR